MNRISDEGFHFFGLEVELQRIGDSVPAPRFKIVVQPNDWAKTVKSTTGGTLSGPRNLQIDYWTEFRNYLSEHGSRFKPFSPRAVTSIGFGVGRAGFSLNASFNLRSGWVDARLGLKGPDAKSHFYLLQKERVNIEEALGFALDWVENPGQVESYLIIRYEADTSDRTQWPELHAWTQEKLDTLERVFKSRIQVLDASDQDPEGTSVV